MRKNLLLLTDSYKFSHWKQYPPGTEKVFSYFESRGGDFERTIFFGLQYFLKEYLEGCSFSETDIAQARVYVEAHIGPGIFNEEGWQYILREHKGKLPVKIQAVPEGMSVPTSNVLMTIENTDPKCFWLTNYLETLLVQVWYPTTVATLSREMKEVLTGYLEETGDPALVNFKLHDFGFRGVSSVESAGIGGAAHLVNFMGTDTVQALVVANDYYNEPMAGFSIPAAEHSTITSWGRHNEVKAFDNMITQFPKGLVAVVSDSYDIYRACAVLWGTELRDKVLARDGVLIIRPDSGEATEVIPRVLKTLGSAFGYELNKKGYKVLNPKVRVIQGDGVDYDSMHEILSVMKRDGWSADNIAFGMGGALLQKLNRDTQKFAFKCSSVTINGIEQDVFKEPADTPWKKSKAGRLKLCKGSMGGKIVWYTTQESTPYHTHSKDMLETVFLNGEIVKTYSFAEVRANAKIEE
jgi:nicotinamide phosphoribosyltransferase